MEFVDISDPRVLGAITFVEEELLLAITKFPAAHLKRSIEKLPWCYYIPATTLEESKERELLIERYRTSSPESINYYLLYHHCDEFSVFYWTILHVNGITTKIVSQALPFRHTYLILEDGTIVDLLLEKAGVDYPHHPKEAQIFDTPREFYLGLFIPEVDRQDWEDELLEQLTVLEK